jgi:phage shock protein PspC (stress-responsive transcriptional regulator)
MNEVTKIHLGRQAFTISVEAHKALRQYLDAIEKQVKDKDVLNEVELRMAELLAEHNVTGDKVILPDDVSFLKEQLGEPKDFKEEGEADNEELVADQKPAETKRLFRDTDDAMIAGVASGLAKYFGVDVLIVRILFIVATFTGGWGILLYIALWILVPEAKTSSERLQMVGKPVTVDSLKEVVERADVKGAARRANNSLAGSINAIFKFFLKLIGVVFIFSGLATLAGIFVSAVFLAINGDRLSHDSFFPVGLREYLLIDASMVVAGITALFLLLFGLAMFKRKWPVRTWITGMLIGLLFMGLSIGVVLATDVAPRVRDRYNANVHTTVQQVQPFTGLDYVGEDTMLRYAHSDTYSVSLKYYGQPDLSKIKITVENGRLKIDSSEFDWTRNCDTYCIPPTYNMIITVSGPNPPSIDYPDGKLIQEFPDGPPLRYDELRDYRL